ncbi:DNA repair protein RecN [Evansella cellulosilytica]|uniref:DNA repair protein RecN n=1 Tax=Evansella cellulosilytica (strain ATCC 21833 / DSM 2522 / FERM P-1141 / JCM 9156 / N-4) TaxID=649639 RepID=E6TXQ9_EVAC2|nr:DNA repair protein RecN [Evansella cellulosilytica]ADU29985.1 DNA repair protein RecN [Evansella cellulosilytica DSM 2522]
MLMELSIRNFAIIDYTTISFEKGLTVLTGETGAGKSIIIDAIGQLIGGRGSVDFVRHGSARAEIEGLFSIEKSSYMLTLFENFNIDYSEDDTVLLKREITKQGKSVCRINGKLVTLAVLREIGQSLVDIHGQHEHQHLLQMDKHLLLLDRFAENKLKQTKKEYEELYERFYKKREKLKQLTENENEMMQRLDLIQYQLEEITNAKLQPNEDLLLKEEKQRLDYSEELYKSVHSAYEALYGDQKGLEWIMHSMQQMEDAAKIDESLQKIQETISNCYYLLEESVFSLRDYYEKIEFDPNRLDDIETRLNEINHLKRKYGESVNEILEYASHIEEEIDLLKNRDERLQILQDELKELAKDLLIEGNHLTTLRKEEALRLKDAIQEQLRSLYMKDTTFEVNIANHTISVDDLLNIKGLLPINKNGLHSISFMVSTNKGEPLKPLAKVASGGEMSRMILALKTILASHENVTSLIFDEVDVGVSGRVAQAIAEKIYHISFYSQVLCITHLPQVAAMADTHLFISKEMNEDRVKTVVEPLSDQEKIEEVSRMISGVEITDLTRQHAKELIQQAKKLSNNY